MRREHKAVILVLLGFLVLALGCTPALAADPCSTKQAKRDVLRAKREYLRAAKRYREAKDVLAATRKYVRQYGQSVGRWTRLARRTGWGWGQLDQLMHIIDRESGGNPKAKNPSSTASGLLQFLAFHWDGSGSYGWRFDPFSAKQNLKYGQKLWRKQGFAPWAL
jgi:soluble lytic murein transglycosylase-like protein